jgi:hypothetical protein
MGNGGSTRKKREEESDMTERQQQLLIRFRGICAHIDLEAGKEKPYGGTRLRTILIRHSHANNPGIEHHIPYLEFYPDDLQSASLQLPVTQYSRPGSDGRLARIEFDVPMEIRLKDISAGDIEESLSFENDLSHMKEILPQAFEVSDSLCVPYARDVDPTRVAAVFDLPAGRIVAGEPEAMITRFPEEVAFARRRLPRWTDLYIEYTAPLVVQLTPLGTDVTYEVTFKSSLRMLTFGNEPERLILGVMQPGPGEEPVGHTVNHASKIDPNAAPLQPTGHFILYYDLLKNPPPPEARPLPIPSQINGPGCPNHVYP